MHLSNEIAELWEIVRTAQTAEKDASHFYPFMVVCHSNNHPDYGYPFKTEEEATKFLDEVYLKGKQVGEKVLII